MDYETYYTLIEEAGVRPLCEQMYKIDKYPAMRYFITMEKIFCGGGIGNEYVVDGKYDELAYSNDLVSDFFTSFQEKLNIKPENNVAFWDVAYKIFNKFIMYVASTPGLDTSQKIELLIFYKKGIQTRRLLDSDFAAKTTEITNYIDNNISELQKSSKSKNKPKRKKQPKFFESFFYDQTIIPHLIKYLQTNNILDSGGRWVGTTTNLTELMGFIDALKLESFIDFKYDTIVGRAFALKLNCNISDRSLTEKTNTREDTCNYYIDLIQDFKSQNKELFNSKL